MKNFKLFVLLITSLPVAADPQWCKGVLTHVYVAQEGELVIHGTWRNEHTVICNVEQPRSGISVEVCNAWLSMALAAKMAQADVTAYYSDVESCSSIPAYGAAPNPGYFMLRN